MFFLLSNTFVICSHSMESDAYSRDEVILAPDIYNSAMVIGCKKCFALRL